jgi:hypothetical protein
MLHYKAFSSDSPDADALARLETTVNAWLNEAHPLVHTMTQSPFGMSTVVSFLYEDDEEQRVATATAEADVGFEPSRSISDELMITLLPQMELPY